MLVKAPVSRFSSDGLTCLPTVYQPQPSSTSAWPDVNNVVWNFRAKKAQAEPLNP